MSGVEALRTASRVDRLGIWVSLICAIQCMAAPLMVTLLPLSWPGVFADDALETLFVIASVGIATGGLCWGFRLHRRQYVFLVLGTAVAMIGAGRLLAHKPFDAGLVMTGAMVLTAGHLLNRHLCRTCAHCPHTEEDEE